VATRSLGVDNYGDHAGCNWRRADRRNHPVNCVDWAQSKAYCERQGKRLPTEDEWEWAARGGVNGWNYPWGNGKAGADRNELDESVKDLACWPYSYSAEKRESSFMTCPGRLPSEFGQSLERR